jgi:hypothetical protein
LSRGEQPEGKRKKVKGIKGNNNTRKIL